MPARGRVLPGKSSAVRSGTRGHKPNVRVAPRAKSSQPSPKRVRVWLAFLALWLALLSGGAAPWTGTPGVIQQIHLSSLLDTKQDEQAKLQSQIEALKSEAGALETSRAVQHREIRRVLNYAADDEIIFDFDARDRSSTL
jgi:cell division protein FtsB